MQPPGSADGVAGRKNAIVKTKVVGIDRIDNIVAVVDPIVFLVGVMPAL